MILKSQSVGVSMIPQIAYRAIPLEVYSDLQRDKKIAYLPAGDRNQPKGGLKRPGSSFNFSENKQPCYREWIARKLSSCTTNNSLSRSLKAALVYRSGRRWFFIHWELMRSKWNYVEVGKTNGRSGNPRRDRGRKYGHHYKQPATWAHPAPFKS